MARDPFLSLPRVHRAINQLASQNDLVIYCGAGVTRDRTGLGWSELVSEVFKGAKAKRRGRRSVYKVRP